jgi:thymidine kinase
MFSEKTSTTRSLLNNYGYALGEYVWIKPDRDNRGEGVTTHNEDATKEMQNARAISWERPDISVEELKKYPIVAIDEVQFFADRILYVIHQLLKAGCLVIANGLKLDYKRDLFGMTHYLLAEADEIISLKAVCSKCKTIESATRTKKHSNSGPSVETGGSNKYYVVCPKCDKE